MILSDHTIREELAAGRIVIDPVDESCIQPSSVDLRLDSMFRVFLNHTMPVIDVKQDLEDLTRLVQIDEDDVFILHPGEFVLASTYEQVTVPDDLVARIEGKSSLGRLGLLIHSSLPGSEPVLVLDRDGLVPRPIEEVVRKRQRAMVAAFDPDTFRVGYHQITGWYEGPPDRIYQIRLASGRRVRVTAGHNLFTIDRAGELTKVRTGALRPGMRVAVPRLVPDPGTWSGDTQASLTPAGLDVAAGAATDIDAGPPAGEAPEIVVADLVPESATGSLTVSGPAIRSAFEQRPRELAELLRAAGYAATTHYRRRAVLPYGTARLVPGLLRSLGRDDRIGWRGGRNAVPARIAVDADVAWLLGLYVAEGYRGHSQVMLANTDQAILDRVARTLRGLGLSFHRAPGAVTCGSSVFAALLGWLGTVDRASTKRVPAAVFGWPRPHVQAFVDGVVAGDGSLAGGRTSVWTTSDELVGDLLLLFARLGRSAESAAIGGRGSGLHRSGAVPSSQERLVEGDLVWDAVVAVEDTGTVETIFDLEVRPAGRKIENFLAGHGGVFVSNTAGFVDAGFSGHITLELSNVANLPITLYPRMKIGQISFLRMTTPADQPYGAAGRGSRYQGQRGPTPSRYWTNFQE